MRIIKPKKYWLIISGNILDIYDYKGYKIKIAEILDTSDLDYESEVYYAISDTGDPFLSSPPFYDNPEYPKGQIEKFIDNLK